MLDTPTLFEYILFMASTTIHIPEPLLELVDARARAEGISRNRFILLAVKRALEEHSTWSPAFLAELRRQVSPGDAAAIDELASDVVRHRKSKRPPAL